MIFCLQEQQLVILKQIVCVNETADRNESLTMLHRQPKPDLQVRKAARRQLLDLCPQGKTPFCLLGSLLKEAERMIRPLYAMSNV